MLEAKARRPGRRYIVELAEQLEPSMRDAFLGAVDNLRGDIKIGALAALLEQGKIDEALAALAVTPALFRGLETEIRRAYEAGGKATVASIPKRAMRPQVIVRFDPGAPSAEAWLSQRAGTLIRDITDEQLELIRRHLINGMNAGVNPRTVALDLAGRINRATGRREGGLIGLTESQWQHTLNYREELLSGNASALQSALGRQLRDRRFDRAVLAALKAGTPIDAGMVEHMVARYRDNYLGFRAETIARREMILALNASAHEGFRQAVARGSIRAEQVRRFWRTAGDSKVRPDHVATPGLNPDGRGLEEPFVTPDGPRMYGGLDPNCRCWVEHVVDWLADAL